MRSEKITSIKDEAVTKFSSSLNYDFNGFLYCAFNHSANTPEGQSTIRFTYKQMIFSSGKGNRQVDSRKPIKSRRLLAATLIFGVFHLIYLIIDITQTWLQRQLFCYKSISGRIINYSQSGSFPPLNFTLGNQNFLI